MAVLTRKEITALIKKGDLGFAPKLDKFQLQPHSVDLRLGTRFYVSRIWKSTARGREILSNDCTKDRSDMWQKIELRPGQYFQLAPHEFVLATTLERIYLNSRTIMGTVKPRSSVNRRGIIVDVSGVLDARFRGLLFFPLENRTAQVATLYPGERVCHIVFQQLKSPITAQEAKLHGMTTAKYHESDTDEVIKKRDSAEELAYLTAGKLAELKKKYGIKP